MTNNLKIKKYWITTFSLVFFSLFSFAQELSDAEIGFDVPRVKASLKEHGVKDQDMLRKIDLMRELQKNYSSEKKKIENEISEKMLSKKNNSSSTNDLEEIIPQSEKDALKLLYDSTNGDNWTNHTGWDFSTPVSNNWYGVGIYNGHVTSLVLSGNNLNNGNNPFPNLSALTSLYTLSLAANPLTGSIDVFRHITSLKSLSIGFSNFSDVTIPTSLQSLTDLQYLDMQGMGFNQTSDIVFIANNFPNLRGLNLYVNNYSGALPIELQNLNYLTSISFSQNFITDISALGNLPNLKSIGFVYNKITSIPSNFNNLNPEQLLLSGNLITGSIPSFIQNYSKLGTLWLSENFLEGNVPDLTALPSLRVFHINVNKFRFIDFADQFQMYKTKLGSNFNYYQQDKINKVETITRGIGRSVTLSMYPAGDNRYLPNDTFKWFKNNIEISGATGATYTIQNLTAANAATYICRSYHNSNPDMSPFVLERQPVTLKIINCPAIDGSITSISDKFYTAGENSFAFESTVTGLTYEWSLTTAEGTPVDSTPSSDLRVYNYTFANSGNYILKVTTTDINGCTNEFTKSITVEERYCANEPIDFAFETTAANLTYTWTTTDSAGTIVNRELNVSGTYTFSPQIGGEYTIELVASSPVNCKTLFTKNITVDQCTPFISCTRDNVLTPEIHQLFINMITKLASTPAGSDVNVYAHKEIAAVAPYTTDLRAKIYNFSNTAAGISFSFSDTAAQADIYLPKSASGSIATIDLSRYVGPATSTLVATSYSNGVTNVNDGRVKNIDFCPKELSCVSHVALVVDESGSLDQSEINKIKKQLKLFVTQQAQTNDDIGSNIHVSITGMSDSDANTRTDFISPTKMSMSNVNMFYNWIDKLGKRYGDTGVSQASDYWKSGLDGALNYTIKPTFVLMITDGAQTDNVAGLKETLAKFDNNNKTVTDPKLPHLYVVGIENGIYIDRNSLTGKALPRNEDPNYNPAIGSQNNLTAKTTPFLTKSLQFLLDLSPTEFPVADINQFTVGTYFGHSNFDLLASDETYFSDKLIVGEVVCGTPAVKDSCDDCFSFKPEPGKEYVLSAWVKEESNEQVKTYTNPSIKLTFYNNKEALDIPGQVISSLFAVPSGDIIDGWQRVVKKFTIPANTITLGLELENLSPSIPVYFDDIRIHPLQGSVKSFVYDPETFKLMSELDENNYSTFYEYDNEGGLVRVKKETAKGIKTIQETRSGNVIETTNTTP